MAIKIPTMKPLGYVIYNFYDFKSGWCGEELKTSTCQPHPEYKKRIYTDLSSAEDAVQQMTKNEAYHNAYFHILPIYTPQEDYNKLIDVYKERISKS